MRPFLKWPGSKARVCTDIAAWLPKRSCLVEPFAGSAALFLACEFESAVINDLNVDLVQLFQILKQEGASFIQYTKRWFTAKNNTPERYYQLREKFNQTTCPRLRSALFIYLNRHGYNGLCRYNLKGGYNVPFGRYKKPYFPAAELKHFYDKASRAQFTSVPFQVCMQQAPEGSVVYCDPPYVPLSETASFTSYAREPFTMEDHKLLAATAAQLARRGIPVMISNHQTPVTQALYRDAKLKSIMVQRRISCMANKRLPVREIMALYE